LVQFGFEFVSLLHFYILIALSSPPDYPELTYTERVVNQNKLTKAALSAYLDFVLMGIPIQKSNLPYWEVFQAAKGFTQVTCPVNKAVLNGFMQIMRTYKKFSLEMYHSHLHVPSWKRVVDILQKCSKNSVDRQIALLYGYISTCGKDNVSLDFYLLIRVVYLI